MCSGAYRPRPDNGSGDSPRPPFLTEFVNQIGKLTLVELVYHLFGGQLGHRIHPHVERSFRLKTKAARGIGKLQAANPQVREQAVGCRLSALAKFSKRSMAEFDYRPILHTL